MKAKQLAEYILALIEQGDLSPNASVVIEEIVFIRELIDVKPDGKTTLNLYLV